MDTLIHADIFFFVTTIVVVVVALVFVIVMIYLIQILRRIRDISEQVREETVLFREDIHGLRDSVRREGFKVKHIFDFASKMFLKRKTKRSKD